MTTGSSPLVMKIHDNYNNGEQVEFIGDKSKNNTKTKKKKMSTSSHGTSSAPGESWRNLVGFFIVGLMNNFCYVLMLTAAEDLIHGYTGIVLLCDVLPALAMKLVAPFFMHLIPYNIRVMVIVLFACMAFQTVAWFDHVWIKMLGVCFGSISSGIGEVTFLAMSSYYHKNTISAWSSGTGGAGIVGSFSYLLLHTWIKLTPFQTLLTVTPFPLLILVSVFLLMTGEHSKNGFFSRGGPKKPTTEQQQQQQQNQSNVVGSGSTDGTGAGDSIEDTNTDDNVMLLESGRNKEFTEPQITFLDRLKHLVPLSYKYMAPLFIVYYSEYLINQSVAPNLKFKTGFITTNNYVYYANMYQFGVFISRSSVSMYYKGQS